MCQGLEFITLSFTPRFRLLTEYRSFLLDKFVNIVKYVESFRLLTEYRSFLFKGYDESNPVMNEISFRLLTEYRSFLCDFITEDYGYDADRFPSPYGVSFILILQVCN